MICIVLEGNIGAGKTTLAYKLKDYLKSLGLSVFISVENVESWVQTGILQKYYSDMKKWAFAFQQRTLTDCFLAENAIGKAAEEGLYDVAILERSYLGNSIFASIHRDLGNIEEEELNVYYYLLNTLKDITDKQIKKKTFILDAPVERCMENAMLRGRSGEQNITVGFLKRLHDRHSAAMDTVPVEQILTWEKDWVETPEHIWKVCQDKVNL